VVTVAPRREVLLCHWKSHDFTIRAALRFVISLDRHRTPEIPPHFFTNFQGNLYYSWLQYKNVQLGRFVKRQGSRHATKVNRRRNVVGPVAISTRHVAYTVFQTPAYVTMSKNRPRNITHGACWITKATHTHTLTIYNTTVTSSMKYFTAWLLWESKPL
jgi:hypothetical protein